MTNDPSQTNTTPNDCLILFSSAISSQPGSFSQRSTLNRLKELLESNPAFLPILYPSLLALVSSPNQAQQNQVYRKWVAGIIELAVCKTTISAEQRVQLVLQSTETIHRLITLQDPSDPQLIETKKLAIQAFSSAYPILFKHTCTKSTTTTDSKQWGLSNQIKGTILGLWRNDNTPLGIRLAGNKFVQRVVQVGTRGVVDPRKRNDDPSIVMCGTSSSAQQHPYLKAKELEQEASNLLEESIRILFQSKIPELVSAIVISIGMLVRLRPSLSPLIITSLVSYNPASSPLMTRTLSIIQLKGVEKTLRITLSYLDRSMPTSPLSVQIREALVSQTKRLEEINEKERERKRQRKEEEMGMKKRARAERAAAATEDRQESAQYPTMIPTNQLPGFDVTSLPIDLVVELVIANLQVLSDQVLKDAVSMYLRSLSDPSSGSSLGPFSHHPPDAIDYPNATVPSDTPNIQRSASPVRPDIELVLTPQASPEAMSDSTVQKLKQPEEEDEDEDEDEDDRIAEELILHPSHDVEDTSMDSPEKLIFLSDWHADEPTNLSEPNRTMIIRMTLDRIVCDSNPEESSTSVENMWNMLLSQLVTRGMGAPQGFTAEEIESRRQDIRRALFSFVVSDFSNRVHFARTWLTAEWSGRAFNREECYEDEDKNNLNPYDRWLNLLLDHIIANIPIPLTHQHDQLKHSLSHFLLDLPHVPDRELSRLRELCQDPKRLTIGFTTLRELTSGRPRVRNRTLDVLLSLCTHSQRQTRNAAIMSVKSWVTLSGNMKALGERVVSFAVQLLQELEKQDGGEEQSDEPMTIIKNEIVEPSKDVEMEDGETTEAELAELAGEAPKTFVQVEDAVIVSGLSKNQVENVVVQHLELLLALSVKNPDLLDHLSRAYPNMSAQVQESVNKLITPLVRSLGGKHSKIISLIQNCQAGSEPLVLRILSILTEKGKPPPTIIEAIKSLAASSTNLSPRFIIPTIGDLTKAEITHHLPRIITLLNGTLTEKNVVRSVFEAIVQLPPTNFGSVSTNAPRLKQSELLTPVELLVLLHRSEEGGYTMKQAIEAIGICFSMTEIFKPEVLAAFMQQVVDELTLPTLFLRTVIQAVQTYKSLQAFVSTTLLSRLILKKIWTQPQLWEGFMRCSKIIAPHSFGALLQLPREQLKELIAKQISLKAPLRDYVLKKAGSNKTRVASLLEILSEQGGTDTIPNNNNETMTTTSIPSSSLMSIGNQSIPNSPTINDPSSNNNGNSNETNNNEQDPGLLVSAAVG